ncbi:hypothetical protein PTTG_30420 [Puccinia triticina 1-1 BBBD Race 1]|uniref:Uncharacterized protein n=1 Tax=Puccinia triticina (isolate 1-1 / race 1 (BBBD)) TaxID=630390 RepID=A0A180FYT5_PUCT1|nr:hypothetical protein PTTG_30420 [Puccinia triticina 1-1 BBBD Race 1]
MKQFKLFTFAAEEAPSATLPYPDVSLSFADWVCTKIFGIKNVFSRVHRRCCFPEAPRDTASSPVTERAPTTARPSFIEPLEEEGTPDEAPPPYIATARFSTAAGGYLQNTPAPFVLRSPPPALRHRWAPESPTPIGPERPNRRQRYSPLSPPPTSLSPPTEMPPTPPSPPDMPPTPCPRAAQIAEVYTDGHFSSAFLAAQFYNLLVSLRAMLARFPANHPDANHHNLLRLDANLLEVPNAPSSHRLVLLDNPNSQARLVFCTLCAAILCFNYINTRTVPGYDPTNP